MDSFLFILLILFIIVLVIGGPMLTIIALGALSSTAIPITVGNWFAALWLHIIFGVAAAASR